MKRVLLVYLIGIIISNIAAYSQTDSIVVADSSLLNNAEKAVELIIKSDSMALSDSIHQIVLTKQLEELHSYEKTRRIKLEKELEKVRVKDSLRKLGMQNEIDRLKQNAIGYPIVIHKDTLFVVFTNIGSLTPKERADLISERLSYLYHTYLPKTDSLNVIDNGQNIDIYFKDNIVYSITELDALWFNKSKLSIALEYNEKVLADIQQFKKDRSLFKLLKEIGLVILIILIVIILIKLINYLFRAKINKYLWNKRGVWFKGIRFRKNEIINENRETAAIIFLLKLFRYALIILIIYLALPLLFSLFPITERFAEVLIGYIVSPIKSIGTSLISYLPKLITIIVIVIITRLILKLLRFIATEIQTEKLSIPGFYADWAKPTYNIVKVLILAFMFIVIFPYLPGSDSAVFKGVSVFIGVVFSLGSSSIIGNMVAGLVITYMRPFKIGDRIKIGEVVGNVVEKTPFVTRIRTPKKEFITIPNSNILASNVINYSNSKLQGGLIVHTTVTIGYDVPWRKVHQILINAAKETSNLNMDIAPFVLQTSLDDFYVSYQLNAHTNEPDKQPGIYSELHQNIQDGFNEAGIEILSPHYRSARDGNGMAIPKDYLPENYQPTGFKIDKKE